MAAASGRLVSSFEDMFASSFSMVNVSSYDYYGESNENGFSHYLEIPIDKEHLEYPLWAKQDIEKRLGDCIRFPITYTPLEKAIIPLYSRGNLGIVKTADSMMKKFFSLYERYRLARAVNGDGSLYFGSRGIIFNKRFELLACIYLTASWDELLGRYLYEQPILKINPLVFDNQQEFMAKAIIQKMIPLSLRTVTSYSRDTKFTSPHTDKCKVIIDDFQGTVVKPVKPSPSKSTNEALNGIVRDNADDILSFIQ